MSFLDKILDINKEKEIIGLTNELKSLYIYNKFKKENKPIIFVTSNLHNAGKIYASISRHTNKVWFFPMDDFLTSEAIAISPEFKINRLETINSLLNKETGIIVTNLMGYLRFLPPKQNFKESYITLKKNEEYNQKELIEKLFKLGYKKQTTVNMTGEIAVRGFVIDIFPINSENPIRIEFWGDTVDTIKYFNIDSQRTQTTIDEITIYPNTEFLIDQDPFEIPYRDMYKYTDVTNITEYLDNPITIYDNYQDYSLY